MKVKCMKYDAGRSQVLNVPHVVLVHFGEPVYPACLESIL